ncbi:MAG: PKD domain-containing protein [Candidatus Woesearchaeota archaeon]
MKKLPLLMAIVFVLGIVTLSSVSAVLMTLQYEGGSSAAQSVPRGTDVAYEYTSFEFGSYNVSSTITLYTQDYQVVETLVQSTDVGGIDFTFDSFSTQGLDGNYIIHGLAQNLETGSQSVDTLELSVVNTAPVFNGLNLSYSYPLSTPSPVTLVDLDSVAFDENDDALTYDITAGSNPDVATCSLAGSEVQCDLQSVGQTTFDVIASDGQAQTSATITVQVTPSTNNAPEFDSAMQLFYSYPLSADEVDMVDLDNVVSDADGDAITFSLDQTSTDADVLVASLTGSTLHADLTGVGQTTFDVIASDGIDQTSITITVQVTDDSLNNAPEFNMSQFYSYPLQLGSVDVVDLDDVAYDVDGNQLSYSLVNGNSAVADCSLAGSVIDCDLQSVGLAPVEISATDGVDTTSVYIYILVYDENTTNNAPEFVNLTQFYMFDINQQSPVDLVDLDDVTHDMDGDNMMYFVDDGFTDASVIDCSLTNSNEVECGLEGVGLTTVDAIAYDGELSVTQTLTVLVYNSSASNSAPELLLNSNYTFPLSQGNVTVVDNLPTHVLDADGDQITFFLDTGFTDSSVLEAYLQGDDVAADLNAVGQTSVRVIAYDGQWASDAWLNIEVVDSANPVAVIDAPTVAYVGEEFVMDGSQSYSPFPNVDIASYQWTVTDAAQVPLATATSMSAQHTFTQEGNYFLVLVVVDSNGNNAIAVQPITVLPKEESEAYAFGPESGLKIRSFGVYGHDFEKARAGESIIIQADIENYAGIDLDGIRMSFTLPEFGVRMKSSAVSLEDGERTTIQIHGFVPEYVEEGVYYPYIEFSDNEIRRVKAGYLEVTA